MLVVHLLFMFRIHRASKRQVCICFVVVHCCAMLRTVVAILVRMPLFKLPFFKDRVDRFWRLHNEIYIILARTISHKIIHFNSNEIMLV